MSTTLVIDEIKGMSVPAVTHSGASIVIGVAQSTLKSARLVRDSMYVPAVTPAVL